MRALSLLFPILMATLAQAEPVLRSGDVLTLTGDSITQQGMYSVMVEDYILLCGPVRNVKVIQCGWGGTGADFMAVHMKDGILKFSPTAATTAFGMNDGGMTHSTPEIQARYRDGLNSMIDNFQKSGTRAIIIGSPGCVDTTYFRNPRDKTTSAVQYNEALGKLTEIARDVAAKRGVLFADLHTPLLKAMNEAKAALGSKVAVCGEADGIHATPNGHLCMAYAFSRRWATTATSARSATTRPPVRRPRPRVIASSHRNPAK